MITASNLTKKFGSKVAVDRLSFEVEGGEVLGFLGPNAAGKTTTMRMLTGYFPPSSGRATVAGFDVQTASDQVRRNIGYLPEHVPLYPEMTTREFVEFAAAAKGVPGKDRKKAVDEAISRCNLQSVEDQLVGTVSRGYRQRVGLAQAIVNRPKVLILDEPTVGLDPGQIQDIRALIKDLSTTSTVLLSTHILPEVEAMCNRVIILNGGKVRAMDTVANLTKSLQGSNLVQMQVRGGESGAIKESLASVKGVKSVSVTPEGAFMVESDPAEEVRPELSRLVVQKEWELLELSVKNMRLEDIFLKVVREDPAEQTTGLTPATEGVPA